MNIADLQKRALEVRQKYADLNEKDGHNPWGVKDFAMGFAGDFGDLQKLIMAKENMRAIEDVDTKLKHELADCLWSLLVIAEHYQIELESEFTKTMDELDVRIARS
jgi:hypothetical protein